MAVAVTVTVVGIVLIEAPFTQPTSPEVAPLPPDAASATPTRSQQVRNATDAPAPGGQPRDQQPADHPRTPGGLGGAAGFTQADGVLPEGASIFAGEYPGIANLDADLLKALRAAANDSGLNFAVSSGWRSAAYQKQLLDQAVATYGSVSEAERWVAPADKSLHVSGDAVDIDGANSQAWLAEHGASYGLCLVYQNEPWHFELRPEAATLGCPALYQDAAHDPRLQ
ncbi:MAG: M15 family metallopeptidase [Bifidobacteriaceae bacterium]|nr:M15 family metallopeptidase [Bifidobacteriaceae bacterium]